MAKRKRLTPNQKEYIKQLNRIYDIVSREERKGIFFDYDTLYPQTSPKRISKKTLKTLQQLTPKAIREKGYIFNEDATQLIPYDRKKSPKKSKTKKPEPVDDYFEFDNTEPSADNVNVNPPSDSYNYDGYYDYDYDGYYDYNYDDYLPQEAELVIQRVKEMLNSNPNRETANVLLKILDNLLADDESRATMIESLASAEEQAISLAFDVSYGSKEEIVRNSGISLLYLLCGGMPSMSDIQAVEEAVERDFPVNWWSFK